VHLLFNAIIAFSSLAITRDKDVFSNYSTRIEILFTVFSASILNPAKIIDRFFAVFSASAKSLFWRNICYSNS
jgi:hypothetical protein